MVELNPGRSLIPVIIDQIIDMVFSEYPDNGDIRLAIYEQIGENLTSMARCLKEKNPPVIKKIEVDND